MGAAGVSSPARKRGYEEAFSVPQSVAAELTSVPLPATPFSDGQSILLQIADLAQEIGASLPPALLQWIAAAEGARNGSKTPDEQEDQHAKLQRVSSDNKTQQVKASSSADKDHAEEAHEREGAATNEKVAVDGRTPLLTSGADQQPSRPEAEGEEGLGNDQEGSIQALIDKGVNEGSHGDKEAENPASDTPECLMPVSDGHGPSEVGEHGALITETAGKEGVDKEQRIDAKVVGGQQSRSEGTPTWAGTGPLEADTLPGTPASPQKSPSDDGLPTERKALCTEAAVPTGVARRADKQLPELTAAEVHMLLNRNKELLAVLVGIAKLRAEGEPTSVELEFAAEVYANLACLAAGVPPDNLFSKAEVRRTLENLGLREVEEVETRPPQPDVAVHRKLTGPVVAATASAVQLAKAHRVVLCEADRQRKQQQQQQPQSQLQQPQYPQHSQQPVPQQQQVLQVQQVQQGQQQPQPQPQRLPQLQQAAKAILRPAEAAALMAVPPAPRQAPQPVAPLKADSAAVAEVEAQLKQIAGIQAQLVARQAAVHAQMAALQHTERVLQGRPLSPATQAELARVAAQLAAMRATLAQWAQHDLRLADAKRTLHTKHHTLRLQQLAARPRAVPLSTVIFPVPCTVCGVSEASTEALLICDTCEKPYHLACLHPPPHFSPTHNWACPSCAPARPRGRPPAAGVATPPPQEESAAAPHADASAVIPQDPFKALGMLLAARAQKLGTTPAPPGPQPGQSGAGGAALPNVVQWVGSPLGVEEGRTLYGSCCIGGRNYTVRDCALFRPDKPSVPHYIARIQAMWQDEGGEAWVRVSWLYYANDIPSAIASPPVEVPEEVYESNHLDNNLAASITGPCLVLPPHDFYVEREKRQALPQESIAGPLYLCRYLYDAPHGRFVELHNSASGENVTTMKTSAEV